ncbi:hypothetical protein P8452_52114 [Trifolium repens]|nr:hypothetical protein P8452_52114 [Trifolium repens]
MDLCRDTPGVVTHARRDGFTKEDEVPWFKVFGPDQGRDVSYCTNTRPVSGWYAELYFSVVPWMRKSSFQKLLRNKGSRLPKPQCVRKSLVGTRRLYELKWVVTQNVQQWGWYDILSEWLSGDLECQYCCNEEMIVEHLPQVIANISRT